MAVLYQVGRKKALRLFVEALKTPARGRQSNRLINDSLLAEYDRRIDAGVKSHKAVSEVAELNTLEDEDIESTKKQIRRLLKAREDERAKKEQERARKELEKKKRIAAGAYHGTLLGSALSESKTDK